MAFFKKNVSCGSCEFVGEARMGALGMFLWMLVVLLIFFSFLFWPLFLIWPILALLLILFPVGHVCPACGSRSIRMKQ